MSWERATFVCKLWFVDYAFANKNVLVVYTRGMTEREQAQIFCWERFRYY